MRLLSTVAVRTRMRRWIVVCLFAAGCESAKPSTPNVPLEPTEREPAPAVVAVPVDAAVDAPTVQPNTLEVMHDDIQLPQAKSRESLKAAKTITVKRGHDTASLSKEEREILEALAAAAKTAPPPPSPMLQK